MKIAFGLREIGPVLAERQTFFLRLTGGSFRRLKPGDHLWLAEPFHLEARFNDLRPTTARDLGAKPAFAADHDLPPPGYGQRHPARALCRDWHRFHLRILSAVPMRLHELSDRDLHAMGFTTRTAFAAHWDFESALSGSRHQRWSENPSILRFGFELIRTPLPADVQQPARLCEPRLINLPPRDEARLGPSPNLADAAQDFARRYEQPRRLSATAKNPIALVPRPVLRVIAAPPPSVLPRPAKVSPTKTIEEKPVPAFESPLLPEPSFTTAQGDRAFVAALKRERASGHKAGPAAAPTLRRQQTMAPIVAATGACPRCGTRLAFGCEHYPAPATQEAAQ